MTLKSVPIALGFVVITVTQLLLGISLTTLAAKMGGKPKSLDPEAPVHLKPLSTPFRWRSCSPATSGDTPRRIPPMRILPA